MGSALSARGAGGAGCEDAVLEGLNTHIEAVRALLRRVHGTERDAEQADQELKALRALQMDASGATCKRALLLFACHREPDVAAHFLRFNAGRAFAQDMTDRVLPFLAPRFIANQCQSPDSFVILSLVLAEMWEGEPLGNWPRTTMRPSPV